MTRDELLGVLIKAKDLGVGEGAGGSRESAPVGGDPERAHSIADDALLEFIGDAEISAAFDAIPKWYA